MTEKGAENLVEEIMAENLPNQGKEETSRSRRPRVPEMSPEMNPEIATPRHQLKTRREP